MLSATVQPVSPSADGSRTSPGSGGAGGGPQKPNDNKSGEPRVKRKKARRACHSCQRAHLTCGDERPCQRCVHRGIGSTCQDGARKKAKYLNDEDITTPPSINPHLEPHHPPEMRQVMPQPTASHQPHQYDIDRAMSGSMEKAHTINLNSQQRQEMFADDPTTGGWYAPLSSLEGIAFNSNYARGEFAGLSHIAGQLPGSAAGTGGVRTPDNHSVSGFSPSQQNFISLNNSDSVLDWSQSRSNSTGAGMGGNHAYTIATGPGSIATPSPEAGSPQAAQSQPGSIYNTLSGSPRNATGTTFFRPSHQHPALDPENRQKGPSQYSQVPHHNMHPHFQQSQIPRRSLDPAWVYRYVTEPYSYVQAYHRLFTIVTARFIKKDQLQIARAFSAFRPSFIAMNQKLTRDDLVIQEKCCQRAIQLIEASLPSIGTPTLVCRRSGEVVCVGKEFCMLSGWPKEVLLGEKPNLNTNIPHAKDDEEAANRIQRMRQRLQDQVTNGGSWDDSKDTDEDDNPPEQKIVDQRPHGPRPVFFLELLDDESVCEFYEKFSQAAFADSTAKITAKYKILKYKPPVPVPPPRKAEDDSDNAEDEIKDVVNKHRTNGHDPKMNGKRPNDILGSSTTIECMVCWTLRRDSFGSPMLIVMNFLPNLLASSSSSSSSATREHENSNKHLRSGGTGNGHSGYNGGMSNNSLMKLGGDLVPVR